IDCELQRGRLSNAGREGESAYNAHILQKSPKHCHDPHHVSLIELQQNPQTFDRCSPIFGGANIPTRSSSIKCSLGDLIVNVHRNPQFENEREDKTVSAVSNSLPCCSIRVSSTAAHPVADAKISRIRPSPPCIKLREGGARWTGRGMSWMVRKP